MSAQDRSGPGNLTYDIFIAAPLSGRSESFSYEESRREILEVMRRLRETHGIARAYYAGEAIETTDAFSDQSLALERDIAAIRSCSVFLMLYPERIVSSALVEIGYAMAVGKPCIVLARDRTDLPFLFGEAEMLSGRAGVPPFAVRLYASGDDLPRAIDEDVVPFYRKHAPAS